MLDAAGYARLLHPTGCTVDAWETEYLHDLDDTGGGHPVLRWMEGTALRPIRAALDPETWTAYRTALDEQLTSEYPIRGGRALFPFRRVFVVAHLG